MSASSSWPSGILRKRSIKTGARTGTVVVMNPHNGEILAMASYPTFDPNKPRRTAESRMARLNRAVVGAFRAGVGVQGSDAVGGARNHAICGRIR